MATINLATKQIGSAIKGAAHNFTAYVGKGIRTALWGITLLPLASAGLCQSPPSILRGALTTGAVIMGLQGTESAGKGKSVTEVLKGGFQTAAGMAGAALLSHLDARILSVAHQASVIALPSAFLMKAGLYDLKKGHYGSGLGKLLLGTGGILSAAYSVYSTYPSQSGHHSENEEFLSEDRKAFLDAHKEEIDKMYKSKNPQGDWTLLGAGVSKLVFTHPDREDLVIKIPGRERGFRRSTGQEDLLFNFRNMESFRPIITHYDQIVLPAAALFPTSNGNVVVEQKLEGANYNDIEKSPGIERAMYQFELFRKSTGLCDVVPESDHNARFLPLDHSPIPTLGIYDTDCITGKSDTEITNENAALFLAKATAVTAAATALAKKTDKTAPARVLRLGLTFGLGFAHASYSSNDPHQPASTMFAAGAGMAIGAAGSTLLLAAGKALSKVNSLLARAVPE